MRKIYFTVIVLHLDYAVLWGKSFFFSRDVLLGPIHIRSKSWLLLNARRFPWRRCDDVKQNCNFGIIDLTEGWSVTQLQFSFVSNLRVLVWASSAIQMQGFRPRDNSFVTGNLTQTGTDSKNTRELIFCTWPILARHERMNVLITESISLLRPLRYTRFVRENEIKGHLVRSRHPLASSEWVGQSVHSDNQEIHEYR